MQNSGRSRRVLFRLTMVVPPLLLLLGFSGGLRQLAPVIPAVVAPAEAVPPEPAPPEPAPPHPPAPVEPEPAQPTTERPIPETEELRLESRMAPRKPRGPSVSQVPILMYHAISQGPNSLYVKPAEFAAHLDRLKQLGYQSVSLKQLYDHFTFGTPIPAQPVVLTFDDGYADFYTNAMPLMREREFTGTLFVITRLVGRTGFVTWDQVREAASAGFEIGAHTVNHVELTIVSPERAQFEVAESRRVLEQEVGVAIRFFAYPVGRHDDRTAKIVGEAGFLGAVTTLYGMATPDQDPLRWQRIRVSSGVSGASLEAQLRALAR